MSESNDGPPQHHKLGGMAMRDISVSGGAKNMMAVDESDDSDDKNHNKNQQISGTKRRQPPPEFYSSELGQSMQHTSSKRPHLQLDAP